MERKMEALLAIGYCLIARLNRGRGGAGESLVAQGTYARRHNDEWPGGRHQRHPERSEGSARL
jgi:hypothetical protein